MSDPKIFISYSHRDENVKDELVAQLKPLKENGLINIWDDRQILASQKWDDEIANHLESSTVAIMLISPDFLSSGYINQYEIPNILEKEKKGELRIIPIIIRECAFGERVDLSQFQAMPKDAKPINLWNNRNEAWRNIMDNINRMLGITNTDDNKGEILADEADTSGTKLVVLYDQNDREEWQELKKHFFVLSLTTDMELFDIHDDITSGNKDEIISKACATANYILCFVTPDFWKSCYFRISPFLNSGSTNKIIPLKIKNTSAYDRTPLNLLRSYPSDDRFVSDWDEANDGYSDIVDGMLNLG